MFSPYINIKQQIYKQFIQKGGHTRVLTYYSVFKDGIRLEYTRYYNLKSLNNKG